MGRRPAGGEITAIAVTVLAFVAMASAGPLAAQDPRAPQPVGTIPVQVVAAGGSVAVNVSPYFTDPDGDALAYAATTSDAAVATVSVSGGALTITAVAPGTVVVTVFASDPGGLSAAQSTRVTVARAGGAPEPVGTIPVQILAPGQWASVNVSSYFRGPDGEVLGYAAVTSNPAVATVSVSGSTLTIMEVAPGTATVTIVASDPGGLWAEQRAAVTVTAEQARAVSMQPEAARPAQPPVDEGSPRQESGDDSRQLDPVPPRLLAGFLESTGYTVSRGEGHVSAGYLGTSVLAQAGDITDVQPYGVHGAYGVTDELMVAMGSGIVYHDGGDSDFFPYFAPRFRVLDNEQASVTLGSYLGLFVSDENVVHYGASGAVSRSVGSLAVHLAAGLFGSSVDGVTENDGVFAIGADFRLESRIKLVGEFRRVGVEDGSHVLSGGMRFLGTTLGGEAGVAYWLEDGMEIRPVVSVAYRF